MFQPIHLEYKKHMYVYCIQYYQHNNPDKTESKFIYKISTIKQSLYTCDNHTCFHWTKLHESYHDIRMSLLFKIHKKKIINGKQQKQKKYSW